MYNMYIHVYTYIERDYFRSISCSTYDMLYYISGCFVLSYVIFQIVCVIYYILHGIGSIHICILYGMCCFLYGIFYTGY